MPDDAVPKVQVIGPLINEVVEPPDIAVFAVFVIVNKLVEVVVKIPFVKVKTTDTVDAPPNVFALPPDNVILL